MSCGLVSQTEVSRGATVLFNTTFYDAFGVLIVPSTAFVNIDYPNPDGSRSQTEIQMGNAPPANNFTALWDTRGVGVGTVNWSIHSAPTPAAVEDGSFLLTANTANLQTF